MKIVVEGPNNVGKSTLISKLKIEIPWMDFQIEHVDGGCPNDFEFHKNMLELPQNMIFDRFYIGERIYPYIYNREPKLSEEELENLCTKFNDTIVIIVDADYNFILKAYKNKGEDADIDSNFIFTEKAKFYEYGKKLKNLGIRVLNLKNHLPGKGYIGDPTINDIIEQIRDICLNEVGNN